jgi:hypothetical protein
MKSCAILGEGQMAKSDRDIDRLYEERRVFPRGKNSENRPLRPSAAGFHRHEEVQANQFRENAHGPGYDNDVKKSSWLQNGDATTKKSFDRGNAWRTYSLKSCAQPLLASVPPTIARM